MRREHSQTTTEYGLILFILSIAVIGILTVVAGSVTELYTNAEAMIHEALV